MPQTALISRWCTPYRSRHCKSGCSRLPVVFRAFGVRPISASISHSDAGNQENYSCEYFRIGIYLDSCREYIPQPLNSQGEFMTGEQLTWQDAQGKSWRVPLTKRRLSNQMPAHRALRRFVFERDGYSCRQCGDSAISSEVLDNGHLACRTQESYLEVDHIYPLSKGGSHHPNNLQTLCATCNNRKGHRA